MLNFEGIGNEIAVVTNPSYKIPKKIYLAEEKDQNLISNGFLKFEVEEPSKIESSWDKTKERMIFYMRGMSGSGKSFYTGQLLKKYKKMFLEIRKGNI